jgi:hypothetical protein
VLGADFRKRSFVKRRHLHADAAVIGMSSRGSFEPAWHGCPAPWLSNQFGAAKQILPDCKSVAHQQEGSDWLQPLFVHQVGCNLIVVRNSSRIPH